MTSPTHKQLNTIRLSAKSAEDLALASSLLEAGKIVALPTETVYGLAGNGFSPDSIQRIFSAKNRPLNNPLILHVNHPSKAQLLFDWSDHPALISERFFRLARAFWPGPLTMIAKKARIVPFEATAHLDTCAVRVPDNEATCAIMKNLTFPLVMPSANLSTRPSPTCADHVLNTLTGRIDAVVDDGQCRVGIESSVVKIDGDVVEILRPGAIDKDSIAQCLNERIEENFGRDKTLPTSPGQSYLHYSPAVSSVKTLLLSDAGSRWHSEDTFLLRRSDLLLLENIHGRRSCDGLSIILEDDPTIYARDLYDALYACERAPTKALVIVLPSSDVQWQAIIDRLKKTSTLNKSNFAPRNSD